MANNPYVKPDKDAPMPVIHNICEGPLLKAAISAAMNKIATALARSLGPGRMASTAILYDMSTNHQITKDGFSILNRINFAEPVHKVVLDFVREIALQQVSKVGDGSTSAIVASNTLYKNLQEQLDGKPYTPTAVVRMLEKVSNEIIEELYASAEPVNIEGEDLANIAAVSLNNDAETGKLIGDMFKAIGPHGYVNIMMGNRDKTFVEYPKDKGYEIQSPYMDKILINSLDGTCTLDDPRILMFTGVLTGENTYNILKALFGKYLSSGTPIVVLAESLGRDIRRLFQELTVFVDKNSVPRLLNAVQIVKVSDSDVATIEDMAIVFGCKIIKLDLEEEFDVEKLENAFGQAKQVISNEKKTLVIGPKGDKLDIDNRVTQIKNEIKKYAEDKNRLHDTERFDLEIRLARIYGALANIVVGGRTEAARAVNKFYVDDAIAACRSAVKHGYVPGCNIAILRAIDRKLDVYAVTDNGGLKQLICTVLKMAILGVYETIIKNAIPDADEKKIEGIIGGSVERFAVYNLIPKEKPPIAFGIYAEEKFDTTIVNSVETDVQIMKAVVDIVGLLYTSNQLLLPDTNIID